MLKTSGLHSFISCKVVPPFQCYVSRAPRVLASLAAQMVKNLPAKQTWVQSLGWEDPLREGNGNSLQYSCLEITIDRGAWWATVPWGHKGSDTTERLTLLLFFSSLNILLLPLIPYPFFFLLFVAFVICISLTPFSVKCFLYKQAEIHCPSLQNAS